MLNFLFICIYEFFGLVTHCANLVLPRGNMNHSVLLASYFLNTCGNSFQRAVQLIFSSKWKSIAAAVLAENCRELKKSEVAAN